MVERLKRFETVFLLLVYYQVSLGYFKYFLQSYFKWNNFVFISVFLYFITHSSQKVNDTFSILLQNLLNHINTFIWHIFHYSSYYKWQVCQEFYNHPAFQFPIVLSLVHLSFQLKSLFIACSGLNRVLTYHVGHSIAHSNPWGHARLKFV